jgi:signal transduction histidine kinase/CheY-like chemotaxis protein/CHASE3 domain sensor protein
MKLNITKWVYIGFAFAVLFVLLIGITSYKTFTAQAIEQKSIEHSYEVINSIQEIPITIGQLRSANRSFRITGDSSFLATYSDSSVKLSTQLSDLQRLLSDNSAQFKRASVLRGYIMDLLEYLKGITRPIKTFTNEELVNVTDIEESKLDKIRNQLSLMTAEENKLLVERNERNQSLLKTATNVLIVYIILTLLIVFILFYFILKQFVKRREAEKEINTNLKELENLNALTNQKNWLLTGLTQVNTAAQGDNNTVSELCESILKSLQQYLELPAGAFYTVIDGMSGLQLVASVAINVSLNKIFSAKQTLAANSLNSKGVVVIKDVPENYWAIESALGKTKAGEIAYVPLIQNEEIIGVIELGAFKTFSPEQINFLEVAANNIAIALQSAQSQRKIKNLLEQVGQQKDELMNQQEALYKTNEELYQQAEILQKSEEELKVQGEELRKINEELSERNEAIELARQTLSLKAKELEDASKYKSEFLANMSHELRTPLNSILILSRQLSENKNNNLTDKQIEYARIVHKSGTDLLDLINDMLDLSKIEAGKIELYIEEVETKSIEHDIKELFTEVAKEKEINFITEIQPSVPEFIQTDKQRLEQILKNLLSNAFKFTLAKGEVKMIFSLSNADKSETIKFRDANKVLSISVIDNGIGIPYEKQELIFEAFQQVDGSTSRKYGGTGLGLSICKELTHKLGGEMQLKSKEGKGSTFTIYLPIETKIKSEASEKIEAKNQDIDELIAPFLKITDDRDNIDTNDKVVLIIEDDAQFASLLRDFARDHHYKAIIALQGDDGLVYAGRYNPHAIILDIKLPVIDGWTLLKLLKDDEKLKDIPVHIITGTDYMGSAPGNVITYLKKPVDKQDLENVFESLVENSPRRFKKLLLILSGDYLNKDSLTKLIEKRYVDIECTYVNNIEEGIQQLMRNNFDGIIADAGKDLEKAKNNLKLLKENTNKYNIPVIVYIDADISQNDELELMKLSDVVIRNAELSKTRLMDELELFLYKIQEVHEEDEDRFTVTDDIIFYEKKVLLVDDDMRNVFVLSNILEENKMKVTAAVNGKDAIEELKKRPDTDIVLMDIMMPEMDGYQTMEKIRHELGLVKLPIIALTAKAMLGDREKCIKAGASDYISKPVDINKLLSLMRVWLAQQK